MLKEILTVLLKILEYDFGGCNYDYPTNNQTIKKINAS